MGEAKQRQEEIDAANQVAEQAKAQAIANHRAQLAHNKMLEHPAVFAPAFYLADAGGQIRVVLYEPLANGDRLVRGAFVVPPSAFAKMCEMGPGVVAQMAALDAQAKAQAENGAQQPNNGELVHVEGAGDAPGAAPKTVN